jgi:hypothetical protein
MRLARLKKFETVKTPGIVADSPEELAALIADLLLIAERMPGTISSQPTKIMSSQPTKIISGDAEILDKKNLTAIDTGTNSK